MRLEGKVALISGGARGMGATEAKMFAREGAKVVIGDVLEEDGRRTEAEINETGGECLFVHLDVTSEQDWQRAVAATVARFGRLDVLCNNAGITSSAPFKDLDAIDLDEWDRVLAVNVRGIVQVTRACVPMLREAGGCIVNTASIVGLRPGPQPLA